MKASKTGITSSPRSPIPYDLINTNADGETDHILTQSPFSV